MCDFAHSRLKLRCINVHVCVQEREGAHGVDSLSSVVVDTTMYALSFIVLLSSQDKATGEVYFFNFESGESKWEHPCDGQFKQVRAEEVHQTWGFASSFFSYFLVLLVLPCVGTCRSILFTSTHTHTYTNAHKRIHTHSLSRSVHCADVPRQKGREDGTRQRGSKPKEGHHLQQQCQGPRGVQQRARQCHGHQCVKD